MFPTPGPNDGIEVESYDIYKFISHVLLAWAFVISVSLSLS
jgi:hypothetical protein